MTNVIEFLLFDLQSESVVFGLGRLFRGVELSDNMPVAQLTGEELDLHFLVLGQDEERHLKF